MTAAKHINICTTFSKNYLCFARNFIKSFLSLHSESIVYALVVDDFNSEFSFDDKRVVIITLKELNIPNFESFVFKYNVNDLNTAVKPMLLRYVYNKYSIVDKLCYFDPDIVFYKSLDKVSELLEHNNFVITPHITKPIPEDGFRPTEIDLLLSGTYNLGFIGTSRSEETMQMLDWWSDRLYDKSVNYVEAGLYTDQKWINLVPGMFNGVYILTDVGYNVAYWNLHERANISKRNEVYYVDESPLCFFHFSGCTLDNLELISKHQTRHKLSSHNSVVRELFENYKKDILIAKNLDKSDLKYGFGTFDNGVKISDVMRMIYWERVDLKTEFCNPFLSEGHSYINWLTSEARAGSLISNLVEQMYLRRKDLKELYPDLWGADQLKVLKWAILSFNEEYNFDTYFSKKLADSLSKFNSEASRSCDIFKRSKVKSILRRVLGPHYYLKLGNLLKHLNSKLINKAQVKRSQDFLERSKGEISNSEMRLPFGVNIIGFIDAESGVGEGARGIIRAIESSGIPFSLCNIKQDWIRSNDKTYTDFSDELPYLINIIVANADMTPHVMDQIVKERSLARYNIGFWAWELMNFPTKWHNSFDYLNEVWTMSNFCLDAISLSSNIPVVRIPIPIEFEVNPKFDRKFFNIEEGKYVFLFCFDGLSFIERKNPFATAKAYAMKFKNNSDTVLIIKCHNVSDAQLDELKLILEGCNFQLISDYLDRDQVLALLNASNCYVSLHRAEGFGYMQGEAMFLGKSVISTGFSGNIDFMNVSNSNLVKFSMCKIVADIGPYEAGNEWAEPDVIHASEQMYEVYTSKDQYKNMNGKEHFRKYYSKQFIGQRMKDRLNLIYNKYFS